MFKQEWFEIIRAVPAAGLTRVRAWDCAATKDGGDWTVGLLMCRTHDKQFIVENVVRLQGSDLDVMNAIKNTAKRDGTSVRIVIEKEAGSSGKMVGAIFMRELAGYNCRMEHPDKAKEVRAQPVAAQAEAGNVKLIEAPWNVQFLDELSTFPKGMNDDVVDSLSSSFNALVQTASMPFTWGENSEWAQRRKEAQSRTLDG